MMISNRRNRFTTLCCFAPKDEEQTLSRNKLRIVWIGVVSLILSTVVVKVAVSSGQQQLDDDTIIKEHQNTINDILQGGKVNEVVVSPNFRSLRYDQPQRHHRKLSAVEMTQKILPGKLFGCSTHHLFTHSYGVTLATDLFPETDSTIHKLQSNDDLIYSDAAENDLLIYFMHSCPDLDPNKFPGKTIVVSGESKMGVPCASSKEEWDKRCDSQMPSGPRIYLVGPHNNAQNSVKAHWGILLLNARLRPSEEFISHTEFNLLFDHALKPKNTGQHFLIYAASHCVPYRQDAFDQFATIGPEVHYMGLCHGNDLTNKQVSPHITRRREGVHLNKDIFHRYKYALVLENHPLEGSSLSEKIFNAYLGGAIPIYCGPWDVMEIFNPKSFVWYDPRFPEAAIRSIKQLEANPELYQAKLNEPILKDGHHTIEKYFSFRDGVGGGKLKRRIRSMMGYDDIMYHLSLLNEERIQNQNTIPNL